MAHNKQVYQFIITLKGSKPPLWRTIQVPSTYTFYDLHVAIQDAMGWHDSHPHEFIVFNEFGGTLTLGIPRDPSFEVFGMDITLCSWTHQISEFMFRKTFTYVYDCEDNWEHKICLEEVIPFDTGVQYPQCISGKRACPPEKSGGIRRYANLLAILADPLHGIHGEKKEWVESQTGGPFDPEHFDPADVVFSNPKKHLEEELNQVLD